MLQQLCNKISIFLLQIKQAFAVSFGHSKVNHFMANFEWPYDTFAQYIEPISKYCFNKLIFERFLTHKLTLSSTGLFSHPFLSHIIKNYTRPLRPCPPDIHVHLLHKMNVRSSRIFVFNILLFTYGMGTFRPVRGAPNHFWPKFDHFWKISTSPSLASSINQIKQLIAEKLQRNTADCIWRDGFIFYYWFVETKTWITIHRIVWCLIRQVSE